MTNLTQSASAGNFSIGALLSGAFSILHSALPRFLALSAIPLIPSLISIFLFGPPDPKNPGAYFTGGAGIASIISLMLYFIIQGSMVYGAFNEMRGRQFSVGEALSKGLARFLPVLGIAVLSGLAIGVGLVLLVIPGLWLICLYYAAVPVCVVEQRGVIASMGRSAELTKGYRWKVLGLVLIVGLVTIIVSGTLSYVGRLIGGFVVEQLIGLVVGLYSGAFGGVMVALTYYTLRSVKEGIDIDRIANVFD